MNKILLLFSLLISISTNAQSIKEIDKLISSERFDDALNSLTILKNKQPNDSYIYFALGETILKSYLKDPFSDNKSNATKKANNFFLEGSKLDSLNPLNYVGLGIIELFKSSDTIKADFFFARANYLMSKKVRKRIGSAKIDFTDLHIKTLLKLETSELYSISPRFYKAEFYNKTLVELSPLLPDVYIAYGDIQLAQINATDAILLYKKALQLENSALTNYLIAKIYYLVKNCDEAIKYYETALNLDSTFAPAYNGLGDAYYKLRNNKLANINYAHFLALTGNNISAKIHYVNALYKAKDFDAAINIAEDILKADSSRIYLFRLAAYSCVDRSKPDFTKALIYFQKLYSKAREDELISKDYATYGKVLLGLRRDSNDIRIGVKMLEKAYLTDTSDNNTLVELIKESDQNKFYSIEINYLEKKINEGYKSSSNYIMLGKAYYNNKSFHKSDSIYSLITAVDSLNLEAWKCRSNALMAIDPELKEGSAKPAFERILQITNAAGSKYTKDKYEALAYLGSFYMFTKDVNYNKAIEYIKESIDLKINDHEKEIKAYFALGYAYQKSKQWSNAKIAYEIVLKLKPDDIYAAQAINDINKYLSASK